MACVNRLSPSPTAPLHSNGTCTRSCHSWLSTSAAPSHRSRAFAGLTRGRLTGTENACVDTLPSQPGNSRLEQGRAVRADYEPRRFEVYLPAAPSRCGSGPSGPEPSGWLINQLGNPSLSVSSHRAGSPARRPAGPRKPAELRPGGPHGGGGRRGPAGGRGRAGAGRRR